VILRVRGFEIPRDCSGSIANACQIADPETDPPSGTSSPPDLATRNPWHPAGLTPAGHFSTDLDFSAPEESVALDVLQAFDGVAVDGFRFAITNMGDDDRLGDLRVETPFGTPDIGAKLEFSRHGLSLPPEVIEPVPQVVHGRSGFALPDLPVVRMEEAIAE